MLIDFAAFLVPLVAFIFFRIAYAFRTPEYDRAKRHNPGHWI